jgi:hypothetical protein
MSGMIPDRGRRVSCAVVAVPSPDTSRADVRSSVNNMPASSASALDLPCALAIVYPTKT